MVTTNALPESEMLTNCHTLTDGIDSRQVKASQLLRNVIFISQAHMVGLCRSREGEWHL
jgi:hypothetical protein